MIEMSSELRVLRCIEAELQSSGEGSSLVKQRPDEK